jgi:hypothetical protein
VPPVGLDRVTLTLEAVPVITYATDEGALEVDEEHEASNPKRAKHPKTATSRRSRFLSIISIALPDFTAQISTSELKAKKAYLSSLFGCSLFSRVKINAHRKFSPLDNMGIK